MFVSKEKALMRILFFIVWFFLRALGWPDSIKQLHLTEMHIVNKELKLLELKLENLPNLRVLDDLLDQTWVKEGFQLLK